MIQRDEGVVLPALMDVKQVSEYLGLHRVTVVEFARLGKLPAFKVGREWRFRADEIREWMDRQRRNPVVDDRFEKLWQRLGRPVNERRLDLEDVGDLIAEMRGERTEEERPHHEDHEGGDEEAAGPHRKGAHSAGSGQAKSAENGEDVGGEKNGNA